MALKSFKEYLDEKGNLAEPKTEKVPDYHGKTPSAPEKPSKVKPKDGDDQSPAPKPQAPYSNPSKDNPKFSFKNMKDKGIGHEGDKKNSKMPNVDEKPSFGNVKTGNNFPSHNQKKKIKTESIVHAIKTMNSKDFIEFMAESCGCQAQNDSLPTVTAYAAGKYHPYPPEVINYIVALSEKNNGIIDNLVDQINSKGLLKQFMESIMALNNCYGHMADLFEDAENGPVRSKMFVKAMDDGYNKFQTDLYESVSGPIGFEKEDDKNDDEDDGENEKDSYGDDKNFNHDDEDKEDDSSSYEGDEDSEGDDSHVGHDEMPTGENDEVGGLDTQDLNIKKANDKKFKRKFAEDHLLGSMAENQRIKEKMKNY